MEIYEVHMMPSELVRLTLDKKSNQLIIEYGMKHQPGLGETEWDEKQALEQELMEYKDFASAEALEDGQRQELMEKKKRYEKLDELEKMEHIEWFPVEAKLIESILLIYETKGSIETRSTYVENLPSRMLRKIMEPNITLNLGGSGFLAHHEYDYPEPSTPRTPIPEKSINIDKIINIIAPDTPDWQDLVKIKEEQPGVIYIRPIKFLKDKWAPLNNALKDAYGDVWKSKGRGDKDAHWRIELK